MQASVNPQRRILISVVIAAAVFLCFCLCLVVIAGTGWFWFYQGDQSPFQQVTNQTKVDQQMDEIQQQVILLRGLSPSRQVTRKLITTEELRQNIADDFLSDYSDVEAKEDALVLSAFGLLKPDFDLLRFYLELYTEQVVGYYDHETEEMFVVQDTSFNGPERLTYAHEFTHVLQDQIYDIENGLCFNEEACEDDSERCLGIQALLEGDASLLELNWYEEYASIADRTQVMRAASETQSPVYESAPSFIKEDFLFPYTQGFTFVEYLYQEGGWSAVDQAYAQPPVSSEQILHPERYPAEEPLEVKLPDLSDLLGAEWKALDHGVMGEWYTFLILAHGSDLNGRLETDVAQQATAGWGGDAYAVFIHQEDEHLLMVLISEWDSETDASEFEKALATHLQGRFGMVTNGAWQNQDAQHLFVRQGKRTVWLMAPHGEIASHVWSLISSP